ncbi:unnamed protein product, partial [Mesorhabditis spiculigera]
MSTDGERFATATAECVRTAREAMAGAHKMIESLKADKDRDGISLLEVKNHDLLAYMREMALIMERMSAGESIQECGAVERSIRYRTILERIKPLEKKLGPQIDKILQGPVTGVKPKKAEASDEDDEFDEEGGEGSAAEEDEIEGSEDDEDEAPERRQRFNASKIFGINYETDRDQERKLRKAERNKKRALGSTLVQELRQQYSDAPVEEYIDNTVSTRVRQQDRERLEHEESFLMRTRMDKGEIKRRRREANVSMVDQLLKFGDYMAADDELRGKVLSHKKPRRGGPQKRKIGGAKGPSKKKKSGGPSKGRKK